MVESLQHPILEATHSTVIVIGAGMAGLTAAKKVSPWPVIILEARNRSGGRMHSIDWT